MSPTMLAPRPEPRPQQKFNVRRKLGPRLTTIQGLRSGQRYVLFDSGLLTAWPDPNEQEHAPHHPWLLVGADVLYTVRDDGALVRWMHIQEGDDRWAPPQGWPTDFTVADLRTVLGFSIQER